MGFVVLLIRDPFVFVCLFRLAVRNHVFPGGIKQIIFMYPIRVYVPLT